MKLRSLLAALAMFVAGIASAAVDVNRATQAELESVSGVGPAIAGKILDERKNGAFKSWDDFIERVKGVGEGNAVKLSAGGLTVGGAGYKGVAAPAAKAADNKAAAKATDNKPAAKDERAAAKTAEKKEAAVAAKDAKDAKPGAKDAKDAKPGAKDDKAAAAASKDKKAADDEKAKKDAKADAKKG